KITELAGHRWPTVFPGPALSSGCSLADTSTSPSSSPYRLAARRPSSSSGGGDAILRVSTARDKMVVYCLPVLDSHRSARLRGIRRGVIGHEKADEMAVTDEVLKRLFTWTLAWRYPGSGDLVTTAYIRTG